MLFANVAVETILRLYADTLPDALRFREMRTHFDRMNQYTVSDG